MEFIGTPSGKIEIHGTFILPHDPTQSISTITIPSQLYPLTGTPELFHMNNTEECLDEELRQIFNNTQFNVGFCYTNTETLAANLKAAGIPKERYKTYVGWLFIGEVLPIHHAYIVVDDKYILDPSLNGKYVNLSDREEYQNLSLDQLRNILAKEYKHDLTKPNSEKGTFGQVPEDCVYVGSRCKPSAGRTIYNKLIKSHPNHPCFQNINPSGMTATQQQIYH